VGKPLRHGECSGGLWRRCGADVSRCPTAGPRERRFHDLRRTFRSLAINLVSIVQAWPWRGHAKITPTMRYLHHESRQDDVRLVNTAFATALRPAA
jgi:integrase